MSYYIKEPLFPLGGIMISPGFRAAGLDPIPLLRRHQTGDFGETDDGEENRVAIEIGEAVISQYLLLLEQKPSLSVIVITEGDRSFTIVYLADEPIGDPMDNPTE